MKIKFGMWPPAVASVLVLLAPLLNAQSKRLWALKEPDQLVEYDAVTFAPKQAVKVPPAALKPPHALQINHRGQVLFALTPSEPEASPEPELWFWNGQSSTMLDRGLERKSDAVGSDVSVTESVPFPFLSADGEHLFWFANQSRKLERDNLELSTRTTFRAWKTDLGGGHREELAEFAFPDCRCETGFCSETCPEASFWFPDDGVGDFFVVTHWIPGQIGSSYQDSFLYQKAEGKWSAKKLPHALERILDAAANGTVIIEAVPDAGCCGWENQSNDQTLLLRAGNSSTLFDERARYGNNNYDVSFFTRNANLSPDLSLVAMTISSTAKAGQKIRLADSGTSNPQELARILRALTGLPAVEVISPADPGKRLAFLPHATLIGWLNEKEILIVEDHLLASFNVATGARRKSGIKVPDETHAFLR